jgi:hypothetical protein
MATGVNHTRLYEMIEQRDVASRWKLLGRALSSLELHDNGRVALMQLSLRDFADCGADRNDTSGFADMVLHIETVRVAAVVSEAETAPGARHTTPSTGNQGYPEINVTPRTYDTNQSSCTQ